MPGCWVPPAETGGTGRPLAHVIVSVASRGSLPPAVRTARSTFHEGQVIVLDPAEKLYAAIGAANLRPAGDEATAHYRATGN